MAVTRRTFFKKAAGVSVGTAVGALAGLGADLTPKVARAQELRIARAKATPSVCCYCSVGCGLLVHTMNGQIVNIEGNPASPINYGNLCPKGAAIFQLHVNPNRLTRVLHRQPGGTQWEEMEPGAAMDRVAGLVKQARDETFVEKSPEGKTLMMTPSLFSLGALGPADLLVRDLQSLELDVTALDREYVRPDGLAFELSVTISPIEVGAESQRTNGDREERRGWRTWLG